MCGLRVVDVSADVRVIHKQKGLFEYSIEPSSRKMLKHIFLMVVDFQKFSEITFFLFQVIVGVKATGPGPGSASDLLCGL